MFPRFSLNYDEVKFLLQ